jgi:hypothetical protein
LRSRLERELEGLSALEAPGRALPKFLEFDKLKNFN